MRTVLIHSPLVGPATWGPVAEELRARGHEADVPPLRGADGGPVARWQECVASVREAVAPGADPIVLVGHSGGGLLLPAIGEAVAARIGAMVFVDSGLPASAGETELAPPWFLEQLRALAADGRLPPWSGWWGEEAMRELVPDEGLRHALGGEMPSLPLSYFEDRVPSPPGWDRVPCAYLLLSDAYRDAADEATARGWPVETIEGGGHLHLVVAPDQVAEALIRLAQARSGHRGR